MDPRSEQIISQILDPSPMASGPAPADDAERIEFSQILHPQAPVSSTYTGRERRATGYLVADVVDGPTELDGPKQPSDSRT